MFLSARGAVEENQGGLLGIYNYTGTHNKRPYYAKRFHNDTYYLFYKTESKFQKNVSVRCGVRTHAHFRVPELKSGALDRSANLTAHAR